MDEVNALLELVRAGEDSVRLVAATYLLGKAMDIGGVLVAFWWIGKGAKWLVKSGIFN